MVVANEEAWKTCVGKMFPSLRTPRSLMEAVRMGLGACRSMSLIVRSRNTNKQETRDW